MRGACGWLHVLGGSVQAANWADPVSVTDRDLLLAIPLNAPLPRPILDGSEPVITLYDAVVASAERARHAAWVTGAQPAWSPHLTADSLRHVAATSTVTSHHCEILLRSLAARTADDGTTGPGASLLQAADAAGRARASWLNLARALNQVDTDTMRHLAPPPARPATSPCAPGASPTPIPHGPCPAAPATSPGHHKTSPRIPATSRWRWPLSTTPATP